MFDQLPEWMQQASLKGKLPAWMQQDPPPKKQSSFLDPLERLNSALKGFVHEAAGSPMVEPYTTFLKKSGENVRDMVTEARKHPFTFMAGMVGPGELGVAAPELRAGMGELVSRLVSKDHNPEVLDVVRRMVRNEPMPRITAVDPEKAGHMAKVYESLPKNDPAAKSAYDALNAEVAQQLKSINDAGYKIEYVDKDPYANSAEMMKDVRENKRLKVFKTPDDSFHPYMTPAQNDAFRAVHDWIAHAGPGNQFGPIGEENAYRMHAATLSPEAQRALATETRGQNSWVNYGPNAHLPVRERPFAEQKAALWPEDLLGDYEGMQLPWDKKSDPIVSAAVKYGSEIEPGVIHPLAHLSLNDRLGKDLAASELVDGYLTKSGRFITREEAGGLEAMSDPKVAAAAARVPQETMDRAASLLDEPEPRSNNPLADSLAVAVPRRVAQAAIKVHVPGEPMPRQYTGQIHPQARMQAEDELGDLLDDNFEPRFQIDEGFLDMDGNWLTRKQAGDIAKKQKQLGGNPKSVEAVKRTGELKAEALRPADAYAAADEAPPPGKQLEAPNIISRDKWTPTERGVFDRKAPKLQGTAEPDPRMFAQMKTGTASPLAEAISQSPVVEGGLLDDALEGLPRGGDIWYELGPLWQYFEENKGPFTFADWLHASGAGSVQNPTHNELATASALLFGKKRGIDWEMVKKIQQNMHPQEKNLWLGEDIAKIFNRANEQGILLPESPSASTRKVPWYTQGKFGGSRRSLPALDTHERRRITQLAAQDPDIRRLLEVLQVRDKTAPNGFRPFRMEGTNADVIPIGNALDYEAMAQPYVRGGNLLDLPSSQAFQAGRWLGGGEHTGLMSAPFGDYVQTLEDGLLYTARLRGLDESPAGLRKLANSIFSGDEMFAPVYSRKGGFPGVTGH